MFVRFPNWGFDDTEIVLFNWVVNLVFPLFQLDGFLKEAVQMVKPAKGTTTLAFIFKEGVMVAADSRASMGGYICMCAWLAWV